jgi:malate permease and related proteins
MFFNILLNITIPIFLLMGLGVLIERTLKIDLPTLVKLNFNVFLPALVFIKTLDAGLSPATFLGVSAINLAHTALILGLAWVLFSLKGFRAQRPVLTLAALLPNAGNYGIPLAALAFGAQGANVMAIIVMLQIIVTVTVGIWIIDSGRSNWRGIVRDFLKIPLFWAAILAMGMATLHLTLPAPLRIPLDYVSNGLVPVALITLGAQLSRSRIGGQIKMLSAVTLFRLLLSPLLALLLVEGWNLLVKTDLGVAGPVLVIAAGMPAAVNVFILAAEYKQDADLASQAILWSTAQSALTLTAWLAFLK